MVFALFRQDTRRSGGTNVSEQTKVALITGASQGLGLSLATGLAERGWRLVIDGRDPERLDRASAHLGEAGARDVTAVAGDVTDAVHRAQLADAVARFGGVDVVVNNAS